MSIERTQELDKQQEIAELLLKYTPRPSNECYELASEMLRYKDHGEWEEYNKLKEMDKIWKEQDHKTIKRDLR